MLFPKGIERAILLLPFVAIPLFALEYFSGVRWTLIDLQVANLLVATIGISGTHSLFSYSMFFGLPEFKKWREDQAIEKPYLFYAVLISIVACICALTFLMHGVFYANAKWMSVLGATYIVYVTYHTFTQSMGLSQAYTAKLLQLPDLKAEERIEISRLQVSEVKIKKIWLPLQLITSCVFYLPQFGFRNIPYYSQLQYLLWALMAFALGAFFYNAHRINRIRKSNKLQFSWRLILYTVAPGSMSMTLLYIIRAIHAFEYWGVYELAMKNSQASASTKKQITWLTLSLFAFGLITLLFRKHDGFFEYFAGTPGTWAYWIVSFIAAISIMHVSVHVYLDSLFFRMRNPHSRKWIMPLLLSRPAISESKKYSAAV